MTERQTSGNDTSELSGHDLIAPRRLLAEAVGTFGLTFVAAGAVVVATIMRPGPSLAAQVVAPGLFVMAMIYSIGPISGAHINPVVTLAFALRGDFPWHRVPLYWLAQLAGAALAATVLAALFGHAGHLGATLPHHGAWTSVAVEAILTFFLVSVILATAANAHLVGPNAALAVGGTVALDGLVAGPVTGASMNPARSFGPALVAGEMGTFWIYLLGPLIGCLLAVGMAWVLRGETTPDAKKAATGESG